MRVVVGACALALAAAVLQPPAARASTVTCRLHSATTAAHGLGLVAVDARGVSCVLARRTAARVARELARGAAVSVPGSEGVSLSSVACTHCRPQTKVTVDFRSGSVRLTFAGAVGSATIPPLPANPFAPTPAQPGGPIV